MTDTGHTTNQFDSQDTQRYDELMRSINDELEKLEKSATSPYSYPRRFRTASKALSAQLFTTVCSLRLELLSKVRSRYLNWLCEP